MGVSQDSNLFFEQGSQKKVTKISALAVSRLSKYSIEQRKLRYVHNLAVFHSRLYEKLFYKEQRMNTYVTEDGYSLTVTEDVLCFTPDGWIPFGDLKEGQTIYTNGIDTPIYMDKEALKRLYMDEGRTQKEIAAMLGVSERTIRAYVHRFELDKGIGPKLMGQDNPNWKGDYVSKRGGYDRTHEKYDKMKTGVCSRCGRTLPTQLHHDDRNPVNTSEDNLIELCDLCHAMEHHGAVIKWVRPAKIVSIRYGGIDKSYGFTVRDGKSIVIEGFIVEFPHHTAESKIVMEGLRWHRHSQAGRIAG